MRVDNRSLRVVGQSIVPVTDDGYALADGVLLGAAGFDAFGLELSSGLGSSGSSSFAIELRHGADRVVAMTRLRSFNGDEAPGRTRTPPEVDQLEQLDRRPVILASFPVVFGLLAVGHALVLTVRHRRKDLAVLRSLGLTPSQTARTVAWQASVMSATGALLGVPLGLALGRFVWSLVARSYGIADDMAWPLLTLVLVLPGAALFANALAWWPGRRATRHTPGHILRAE